MASAQTQQGKKEANGSGAAKTKKTRGEPKKPSTVREAGIVVLSLTVNRDKVSKQEEVLRVFAQEHPAEAATLAKTYNGAGAIFSSVVPKS